MILQQVNLYQSELKDIKLKYSASNVLLFCIGLVVVLFVVYGFNYIQLQNHQEKLSVVSKAQEKLKIVKAKLESSTEKKDAALEKKIIAKNKELAKKQRVLKVLKQDEFGNADGFDAFVGGLARQRLEGLWLTKLRLANGGTSILMQGSTTNSVLLPKYLQALSKEDVFSGATFEHFEINKDVKFKKRFNFNLNTTKPNKVK